jgi:biopolymer transport protein ExbD
MRFASWVRQESEGPSMTPALGVLFLVMMLFLLIIANNTLEQRVGVRLPEADSAVRAEHGQGEVLVTVNADGTVIFNDRPIDTPDLQQALRRVIEYFPGGSVVLHADKSAPTGSVLGVMDVCRQAGIQNVYFATEETKEHKP